MDFKVNLIFALDVSCPLLSKECNVQKEFISDLFERTKDDYSPRISFVEYAETAETVFNFTSTLNDDMDDFVSYIRGMECDADYDLSHLTKDEMAQLNHLIESSSKTTDYVKPTLDDVAKKTNNTSPYGKIGTNRNENRRQRSAPKTDKYAYTPPPKK